MTKRLLLASALLSSSASAFAQLNDTALGLDVYGITMKDSQHERSWVHFRSNDTHNLQRHDMLFPDDEYMIRVPRSGAMTPDGFVGYFDCQYTFVEDPLCFYKMDINTGHYTTIADMTSGSKWTNPTTCWNRTELKNLSSIYIARDSEPNIIGSVDAEGMEGDVSTYIDTDASQGVHTYYIIPANASGKGVPCKYLAQAGEDTPGHIVNLSVTKVSDASLTISWSKPTIGAHDGWYDESSLTYDIVRMPDGIKDTEMPRHDPPRSRHLHRRQQKGGAITFLTKKFAATT